MGITLKSNTSLQSKATRVVLPVNEGLVGAYFFSQGSTGKNYAPDGVKPTVVGIPNQISIHGQILDRNNYIDTNISVANKSNTLIAVFGNKTTTGSKPLITNYATASSAIGTGAGLHLTSSTLTNIAIYNKSTGLANINGEQLTYSVGNYMVAGVLESNSNVVTNSVYNLKTLVKAVKSVSDSVGLGYSGDGETYRIGNYIRETGSITPSYGQIEFYAVLMFDRALNDTELSKISEWVKSFCINRSIIV